MARLMVSVWLSPVCLTAISSANRRGRGVLGSLTGQVFVHVFEPGMAFKNGRL